MAPTENPNTHKKETTAHSLELIVYRLEQMEKTMEQVQLTFKGIEKILSEHTKSEDGERVKDHESRIRQLETTTTRWLGSLALVAFIVPVIVKFL